MSIIKQIVQDPTYFAKRSSIYAVGKRVAHDVSENGGKALGSTVGETLRSAITPETAGGFGGLILGLGENMVIITGVGLTAAISAGLTQLDYYHRRNNLTELYKEELAAKLKKPLEKVTAGDLDTIAKGDPAKGIEGNRAIAEELGQSKRERNFGVVLSVLASMAAFGAVAALTVFTGMHPPPLLELFNHGLEGIGALGINMAVGLATYNAVKIPLHWIGDKLFGIDKETTHDRIESLHRDREAGKIISQEQVLAVFAGANLQLDRYIAARYGKSFEKLGLADKQKAVEAIGNMVPLESLTSDINAGKINVTELAFAVEGQISGVEHEGAKPKQHGLLHGMWTKMRSALHFKPHAKMEVIGVSVESPGATAVAYAETRSGRSFVERLGRQKLDASMGHVKLLDQQAVNSPISQTIQ